MLTKALGKFPAPAEEAPVVRPLPKVDCRPDAHRRTFYPHTSDFNLQESKPKPTLLEIAIAFVTVGLTSIGGAAGPLRNVIVVQRRWITESELAELYGLAQALPGSVVANVAVLLGPRYAGVLGPFVALAGLIVPSMVIAIAISGVATGLAAKNSRFAAAEVGVTAALAGIFVSNGLRVLAQLWSDSPDVRVVWRCTRVAIGALGVALVTGLHVNVPVTMIALVALSMFVEWRLRDVVNAA